MSDQLQEMVRNKVTMTANMHQPLHISFHTKMPFS